MSVQLTGGEFPIVFEIPEDNILETFRDRQQVEDFLNREILFWDGLISASKDWQPKVRFHPIAGELGRSHATSALAALASASGAADVHNILDRLQSRTAVFGSGRDGAIINEAIADGYQYPHALAMAAASASRAVHFEQFGTQPFRFADLIISSSAAAKLAELRNRPNNLRADINRTMSRSRETLKSLNAKTIDIDAWFEHNRARLEEQISATEEKASSLAKVYQGGFEKSLQLSEDSLDRQYKALFGHFQEVAEKELKNSHEAYKAMLDRLQKLETVYSSKLVLEGPSRLWRRVGDRSRNWAIGALVLFVVLLILPASAAALSWSSFSKFLADIVANAGTNGFSLTALAILTIPALGYGWLLRHVSRVYIHNIALKSDAEYREVLATTFLGLAEQNSVGITEAERALVLNALFRPAPPHAAEDGPPVGLMDLLKK